MKHKLHIYSVRAAVLAGGVLAVAVITQLALRIKAFDAFPPLLLLFVVLSFAAIVAIVIVVALAIIVIVQVVLRKAALLPNMLMLVLSLGLVAAAILLSKYGASVSKGFPVRGDIKKLGETVERFED